MTTYSSVLPTFVGSTVGLKDAMNSVGTLMTNAGWALSADTGQVDISTVTYNSTAGTVYGYKIWYLNDSLHATYPIYLRMYWRMSASSTLAFAYTVGHATDGAGNITGYKNGSDSTYMYSGNVAAWGTAANASKAVSLSGFSYWHLAPTTTFATGPMFMVSREWDDTTGAIASNGNYGFMITNGTPMPQWFFVNRASSTTISTLYFSFAPAMQATSQSAGTTDVFRHYAAYPEFKVMGCALSYHAGEITQWNTFSAQPLTGGSARTFLATGNGKFTNGAAASTDCLAVLWE